jgi:putative hydrolase of the HAD superfamily
MVPPGVGAVFFDAVGTLIHPEPPAPAVYLAAARRHGSRLDLPAVEARFRAAFARQEAIDRAGQLRTSEERERARWRAIVGEVLDDVAGADRCFDELFAHFSRPASWRCEPGAAATLAALADRGYLLGMASNYDARLRGVAAGLPELRAIRHFVISSEVGWRKPAPEFFAAMCETAGLLPEQVLFVGDDPHNDGDGGRGAGLHVLLLDPRGGPGRLARLADLVAPSGG